MHWGFLTLIFIVSVVVGAAVASRGQRRSPPDGGN